MTFTKFFLLLLLVLANTFAVRAVEAQDTEVYKTVDENGEVTFGDTDTKGAEIIEVQPNVVDVPVMPASTVQESVRNQASGNQIEIQQEAVGRGTADDANLRRRIRNETNGEVVGRPGGVVAPYGGVEAPRREVVEPHDSAVTPQRGVGVRR